MCSLLCFTIRKGLIFVVILLFLFVQLLSAQQSCNTPCYTDKYPYCGTWMQWHNTKEGSGVYILDSGHINLTCVINSLPQPVKVQWLMKIDHNSDPIEALCSSLKTTSDCSYNEIGEHRVKSTCLIKVSNLDQTGTYFCRAIVAKEEIVSRSAHIDIFGISNLTVTNEDQSTKRLKYGQIGELNVSVCANPKPEVLWVHKTSGNIIKNGEHSTNGNYSVLALQPFVRDRLPYQPAETKRFCYVSKLIISNVHLNDSLFSVIISNSIQSVIKPIYVKIDEIPIIPSSGSFNYNNCWLIHLQLIALCLSILVKLV